MNKILNSIKPIPSVLLWGIIGGLGLIFIASVQQNALVVILTFSVILVLSIATVKLNRPNKIFLDLFLTTLSTFTVAMSIDYVFIITSVNTAMLEVPFFGHLWRIAAMLGIGVLVSLALTFLATLRK